MATPRYQSNAVDTLIDTLLKSGLDPSDVREHMWQAAWARGYQDVSVPVPMPETKIEGFIVLARVFSPVQTMVLIDDGERLLGVIDEVGDPPLGAKVRLVPNFGVATGWSLKVLSTLGCGLQIRFDADARPDTSWIDRLRHCLTTIREEERLIRRRLENERALVEFVPPPKPFRLEMEAADKEIRERVLAGGYTEEEKRMLARAKSPDQQKKVIEVCNKRLVEAYRAEVVEFRQKIPEIRGEYDKLMDKYAAYRQEIDRINEGDATSRSVTDASLRATQQLEAIEAAVLNVRAVDLARIEEHPRASFVEITQTIDLLFELVPKRIQQQQQRAPAAAQPTAAG